MKITAINYEANKKYIDWTKVPKTVKDGKSDIELSLPFYNKDKDIKETIDLWLSHINKYVKTPAKKTAPAPKKEPAKKQQKTPKKAEKKVNTPEKKIVFHKIDKQNVDHFSNEYMLLRRFYNLINTKKPINFRKIQLLFRAFEKAAVEKKVRKTSKVAGLYNQANAKLVKMYEIAKPNQEDIKVNISDKAFYNRLEKFVTGYQTDPAVRLLKRFINMQGTKPEKTSAKRLLTAITNAINKGKVSTKHRLYKELQEAKKELTGYLSSPVKIKPHQQALNKPKKKMKSS